MKKNQRSCVFCGEPPENKNKEHIFPVWLLEETKSFKEVREWDLYGEKKFNFDSFKFPACSSCNSYYAMIEGEVKYIVKDILEKDQLKVVDISILLDWFDKVRIGLWLGVNRLANEKKDLKVSPKFHILNRVGKSDRTLLIYKIKGARGLKNLDPIGFRYSPIFKVMPSCFSLLINNYLFLSVSSDYINAKGLGFPYPERGFYDEKRKGFAFDEMKCEKRTKELYPNLNLLKPSIGLAQCVINVKIKNSFIEYLDFNKRFVCIDARGSCKSEVLELNSNQFLNLGDIITIDSGISKSKYSDIIVQTFEAQKYFWENGLFNPENVVQYSNLQEDIIKKIKAKFKNE